MGIDEAIIRYGTAAVLEYGKMSGIEAENVIPEKWLPRCPGWVETSSPCLSILRFLLGSVSQFG